MTVRTIDEVFREFETDGVPSSGPHKPIKTDIIDTLNSKFDAANAGFFQFATWAELNASPGTFAGQAGRVTDDAGTHTDPVVGGTVANEGNYSWSVSPAGWQRVGDLLDAVTLAEVLTDVNALNLYSIQTQVSVDQSAFEKIPGDQFVTRWGLVLGARGVSSTFLGWRGTYPYNNETFDGVWIYLEVEADTSEVKLAIYADSSTTEIATCTRLCRGNGWFFFNLDQAVVGSDISTNFVRVGAWVTDGSGRLHIGTTRITQAGSGTDDQAFKTSPAGAWTVSASDVFRPAVRLVDTTALRFGDSAMETAVEQSIIDRDQVAFSAMTLVGDVNDFTAAASASTIFAYSSTQTKPVSFSANGIYLPALRRHSATAAERFWHTITAVVRTGSTTGNVVASGQVIVDPLTYELTDIFIPFVDKAGATVTITQADIPDASYCVQIEAWSLAGAYATFSAPSGTVDIATASHFRTGGSDAWTSTGGSINYALQLADATLVRSKARVIRAATFDETEAPTVALTATVYSGVGQETAIYLRDIVQGDPNKYRWQNLTSGEGVFRDEGFFVTPALTGDQTVTFYANDKRSDRNLGTYAVTMKRLAANAKSGVSKTALFIGDSLASGEGSSPAVLPVTLLRSLATAGSATLTFIGSSGTGSEKYETFPGQTLVWFYTNAASPFVSGGVFNFANYISTGGYATPDWVFIGFGTNDVNGIPDLAAAGALGEANAVRYRGIAANIRATYPSTKLGVLIPPMGSFSQDAFSTVTAAKTWNADFYKAKMHLYHLALIEQLSGLTADGIYLIPQHIALDTVNNFPFAAPAPINAGVLVTGTFATYAAMAADLTPAHGALYKVTDIGDGTVGYFVKVGPTTTGTWRPATREDGIIRRQNNGVHMQGSGYRQMAAQQWAFLLAEL